MSLRPSHLSPVQRVNHLPNNKQLVRKDLMGDNLNLLHRVCPEEFDFFPASWSLPNDLDNLVKHIQRDIEVNGPLSQRPTIPTYIIKPATGLQGCGIKMTQDPSTLEGIMRKYESEDTQGESEDAVPAHKKVVVQIYITRPLLIDGYKFDIRLYVLVTSIKPLKIYIYDNGLMRLCTTKYNEPTSTNIRKFRQHLTNFAINKNSKNFVPGEQGTKRSLKTVFADFQAQGHDVNLLWSNVVDVVVKTILGMQPLLASAYDEMLPKKHVLRTPVSTCFEIFGFDIMMDEDLKVWLLEMNHMPSLSGSSPLDTAIKTGVVNGALDRLHITTRRKQILTSRLSKKRRWLILQQAANKARALALGQGGPGIPPPTSGSGSASSLPRGGPSLPRFGPPRNSSSSAASLGGPSNGSGAQAGARRSSVAASSSRPPLGRTSTSKSVLPQIVSPTKERAEHSKPSSHDTAKTLASGKGELLSRPLGTAEIEIEPTKSKGRMSRDSRDSRDSHAFEEGSEEEEDDDEEEDGDDEEEVDASTRLLGVGRGEMEQRAGAESRGQCSDVAGTPFADVKVLREAPLVDQPDGYVLVFSQQQLHYRQLYSEAMKAAEVAMKDKVAQSLRERPQSANWMEGHGKSKGG
ncbi:hypothetical protein CYMTET_14441 [Cymbomonas tetramitiformis]|uniref:Uncharacterized protein n=1 Tax=Cymbomonas tetramitiformis TaxID=36881 RepID=A0AAE0LA61_9CHLO|nr:hypothetical protein CYMTET_14441 [Cymbomonas tetramitiformis]